MSDKDFKVKNKLQVKGITSAGPVVSDASGNLDSTAYVATQYGGTGTSTSPSSGQIPYSSSGTTYAPTDLSSLTISSSGGSTITNNSASAIGLVIKGAASQTANLTEWQTSAGAIIASIGPVGDVSVNGSIYTNNAYFGGAASYYNATINIRPQQTSYKGIVIQGRASQTGNLQEWQDSAGTVLGSIGAKGNISFASTMTTAPSTEFVINASNPYPAFLIRTAGGSWINYVTSNGTTMYNNTLIAANLAAQIPLTVKGAASQSANLQEWQDSTSAVKMSVNQFGSIVASAGGTYISSNGDALFGARNATTIPLIVKGATSQTADLQQWQNSAGTVLAAIEPTGSFYGSSITAYGILTSNSSFRANNAAAGTVAAIIKGAASQTANLQEWQDSAGTVLARITSTGTISGTNGLSATGGSITGINSQANSIGSAISGVNWAVTAGGATLIPIVAKGATSQTADLQQWQNSAGTVITRVRPDGQIGVGSTLITGTNFFVNNTISTTNVVATIRGAASQTANLQEWQNSAGTILTRVSSGGAVVTSGVGVFGAQSNTPNAQLYVLANSITNPTLVAKAIASQTANLTEWQDSAGTILSRIGSDGRARIGGANGIGTGITASTLGAGSIDPSWTVITVKGAASQTANLQEWQNSSGTVLASISAAGNLTVQDLTVNGTATTINSTTLTIDDKNIELASVASPTDTTADGAGITIKGATDKTFNWVQSTGSFTSSEPISTPALSVFGNSVSSNITLAAGKRYFVDTTAARTLTLPASPTLGDEIQVFDASETAGTYNITINRNGGKINGVAGNLIIDINGGAATLVYTGSTYGWKV